MLTNTDATLYHRSYNPATRLDEWERVYIPAVWWYEAEQSSVTTEGRKTADTFMVRIPDTTVLVKKDDYLVKRAVQRADEDGERPGRHRAFQSVGGKLQPVRRQSAHQGDRGVHDGRDQENVSDPAAAERPLQWSWKRWNVHGKDGMGCLPCGKAEWQPCRSTKSMWIRRA